MSAVARKEFRHRIRPDQAFKRALIYILLAIGAILVALPFFWLVRSSLMIEGDHFIYPPIVWPKKMVWTNYVEVFQVPYIPMVLFFRNSIILVAAAVTGEVISTSLVGYSFGRLEWWGRDVLFGILVATLFLPGQVTIIPLFLMFKYINWLDTLWPLIVPSWFGHAFYIFLMRQFIMTVPVELDDAARIDGCSNFRIYWNIIVPLSKPALGTVAIFSFQGKWNQFFEPLIYINSKEKMPLAVGVR
ncbi:MAG: carbohydrate ABC transporter permease, partial [Chloroflexi bacterium]|nr:carbohydrate ABC transporter permease [Chloroflexota bacterium]